MSFGRHLHREERLNTADLKRLNDRKYKGVGAHDERMESKPASHAKKKESRNMPVVELINPLPPCFDSDNNNHPSRSRSTSGSTSKVPKKQGLKRIFNRKSVPAGNGEITAGLNNCENYTNSHDRNRRDNIILDAEVTTAPIHPNDNYNISLSRTGPPGTRSRNNQSINYHDKSRNRQDLRTGFTYQGLFNEQGLPDDPNGIMIWSNGDSYQGNFWNGMRDGMGTMSFSDGSEYVGMWECDRMHGEGTRRFANGNVYFGPYHRGKRKGKNGQFIFLNGDTYTGDFDNDQFEGEGVYKHKSGVSFEGSFVNSKRHGLGVCKLLNKDTDTSWYENDKPVGKGVRCNENQDTAWKLLNGHVVNAISYEEAFEILGALHERERRRMQNR